MSKQVDERVVEMRFDNKQFESATEETISTLDKLKQKLQMKDSTKGLVEIDRAAKKVDFSVLGKAVDSLHLKFSALQVVGVTALSNITNSAVNAGKNITKAFTIDPIKTGFQEYETQINAVQTILANTESKGTTLQQVNAALDELNKYADMTIYNFTEMTRNIGTFTAAGVDLDTSVSAIKGIANLAAVSGSNAQQASVAMYQLSQALASGTVKLMDWNSVVNAGMGGQVFQDALKETARVHGIAIDNMIKKEGSFRETLQNGWLTSDILTETLQHFTMAAEEGTETWETYKKSLMDGGYTEEQAISILKLSNTATDAATKVKTFTQLLDTLKESVQSGWTQSWEILIGDFEEAKNFLTDVSDRLSEIIGNSADSRNKILSEGLSSGWKQLLNAGIADEEGFKEIFKSIADSHGTSIDTMIAAEKKLDNSLTDSEAFQKALKKGFDEGKLSSDMLSESVHKMADKMSNMSAKELEAAGYTADHVKQIKDLSVGLKNGSISMDEFVKKIMRTSGRENIIQALWNSFDGLMNIINPVKEAFRDIFPATTGEQLYSFTERLVTLTAKFKEFTERYAPQIKSTFKGLFSIIKIGTTIIKSIVSGITKLIGKISDLSGDFLDITGSLGDWISGIEKSITKTNLFGKAIDKIVGFLGTAIDKFKEFAGAIKEKVSSPGFEWFFNLMKGTWDVVQKIGNEVGKVASSIGGMLSDALRNADIKTLLDILNGGLFSSVLLSIKKYIDSITKKFDKAVNIIDNIKNVFSSVEESLKSWQQSLKSAVIKNIAIAIGILAVSLLIISGIDSDKTLTALAGIGVLMGEIMGMTYLFIKISRDAKTMVKGIPALISMSVAIFILASSLKKLSDLDWNQLGVGLSGIAGLMAIATVAIIAISKFTNKSDKIFKVSKDGIFSSKVKKNLISAGLAMIAMAAAVKILASACKDLSELSWNEIGKGLSGIAGILLSFVGFQKLMTKVETNEMMSSAFSLILIGAAMKIFASASKDFSEIGWEGLGKAAASITVILGLAAGFGKLSKWSEKMKSSAAAFVIIGVAMEIFANVTDKFGNMDWSQLEKAGAAIGGILLLASGFALLSGLSKRILKSVIALTIMSVAMEIFANVADKFGNMDWPQLEKAGAAIGGILLLASGFALLSGLSKGILTSAGALLVMAMALRVLTPVLTTLGNMSVGQIVTSLVTLAGGLTILIGAAALIKSFGLINAMLSMAGTIALIGVACLAAGAGIMMFAAGFTALATAGAAGATAVVAALTVLIIGTLELIPSIVNVLTEAIVAICNVIIQSAPAIGKAIKALVLTTIDVLVECIPALADGLFKMVLGVLDALAKYTPQIVTKVFEILIGIVESAAAALDTIDPDTFLKGIAAMTGLMAALNLMSVLAVGAMKGVLAFGIVIAELAVVLAAIGALAQIPGLEWLISEGGDFLQKVGTAIGQFIGGIVGGVLEGATSTLPDVATNLSMFMTNLTPFIVGAKMLDADLLSGVKTLAEIILMLTGAGILEGISSWLTGGSSIVEFGDQLVAFAPSLVAFANEVSGIDAGAIESAANAGMMLAELAKTLPNSGGVAGFFAGENDMDTFGSQLKGFGKGIADFSKAVTGKVDMDGVTTAVAVGTQLSELAKTLPNSGGVAGFFAGDNDMDTFGSQLKGFGKGIADFSKAVTGKVDMDGVTTAVAVAIKLQNIAKDLDGFDADGMEDLADELEHFGEGIADFSAEISGKVDGLMSSMSTIRSFITTITSITSENTASLSSFTNALGNLSKDGITKFIKAFTGSTDKVKTAIIKFVDSATSTINSRGASLKEQASVLGKALVDGFCQGITENTFKAEAKSRAMAKAAYDAAKNELDVNSPSKKFMKIGKSVVEGFGKGITKNVGDVNDASVKMANGVLESTKNELGINSPSIVFKEEVGRYIVQGIAEGIKSDMSAEEAAEQKANNIINAFKKAIDSNNLDSDIAKNAFDIWSIGEGKYASDDVKDAKQLEYLTGQIPRDSKNVKLAHDKWKEMKDNFGATNDKTKQAYIDYQNAITGQQNTLDAIKEISENAMNRQNSIWDQEMANLDADYDLWESMYGDFVSEKTKNANLRSTLIKKVAIQDKKAEEASRKLLEIEELYTKDSLEYKAQREVAKNEKKAASDLRNEIKNIDKETRESVKESREIEQSIADIEYDTWLKTTGRNATEAEKDAKHLENLNSTLVRQNANLRDAEKEYEELCLRLGKDSAEAQKQLETVTQYRNDIATTNSEIYQITEDAIQREKDLLRERQDLASDTADLQYQIWEKIFGRDAADAEKDTVKLGTLNKQVIAQSNILAMTQKNLDEAIKTYGSDSVEAQRAYNEYLQEEYNLAQLHSDILDVEESIADREKRMQERQRNAKNDYLDYIKKYEKYYLEHGMTLEELEKDAKLVSGYDPDKLVNKTVSDVSKGVNKVINGHEYKNIITNFSNIGTDYATSISEGVSYGTPKVISSATTMVSDCVTTLNETQPSWISTGSYLLDGLTKGVKDASKKLNKTILQVSDNAVFLLKLKYYDWCDAASYLVNGFIEGIRSRIWAAAQAAAEMARAALTAAEETLDINSPSKEFARVGAYAVMGMIEGLKDNTYLVADAATDVGDVAIDNLKNSIKRISDIVNSEIDTQPTIRPILDLSDVASKASRLDAIVSRTQAMRINNEIARSNAQNIQNGTDSNASFGNTYQFTQNNYSPKELSSIEIYRRTKNQFAMMKMAKGMG